MAGLREFVTGSDACTAPGAGPSNAAASLANTLLGTSSKTRQQLQEYAGVASQPAFHVPVPARVTQAGAVQRLAGRPVHVVDPVLNAEFQEFERIFQGAQLGGAASTSNRAQQHEMQPGPSWAPMPGNAAGASAIASVLHNFMRSGQMRVNFQPAPLLDARIPLGVTDQVRIRDRATILSRHLFSEQGEPFADQQVNKLLHAFGINPQELPSEVPRTGSHSVWSDIWSQQRALPPEQAALHSHHDASHMLGRPNASEGEGWAQQFAGAGPSQRHAAAPGAAADAWSQEFQRRQMLPSAENWAENFHQANSAAPQGWAEEFASGVKDTGAQWAKEMEQSVQGKPDAELEAKHHSRRIAQVLAADPEGKFNKSNFLQFLSKMSQGDSSFAAGAKPAEPGEAWATQFAEQSPDAWATQFAQQAPEDWADAFASQLQLQDGGAKSIAERWAEDYESMAQQQAAFESAWADVGKANADWRDALPTGGGAEYVFHESNPYDGNPEALAAAKELFAQGSLSEAVLALEAVVKRDEGNVVAWKLLGTAHAENDDDRQAIAAMRRALAADPNNLDVLLALGVSHVNELQEGQAVSYLMRWLKNHPTHSHAIQNAPSHGDSSQALSIAHDTFQRAATASPEDADVQTALGVIMHLAGNFAGAAAAFETALKLRPSDYSLWNKLGATLANSNRSEEAKSAYVEALKWKPNYMRAWANMGISHGNLGQYQQAAAFYLKALALNANAHSVWGYLRTALVLMGRTDLIELAERKDLKALETHIHAAVDLPQIPVHG